jgi:bacillithiol biosynthesis deacetylase BshB1
MLDLLALGPHPDDVELGAGGTLAAAVAAGGAVGIVDLTAGELGTRGTVEIRRAEAEASALALGVRSRECLGLPDGGLSAHDPDQTAAVVSVLRRHRPAVLVCPHGDDDHPDHVEGAALVERAAYLAGLARYAPGPQEPHRPRRILFAMGRRPFVPTLIVDVSAVYESKRRALACFRSQFHRDPSDPVVTPISEPGFLAGIESRDRYYGARIAAGFGEAFFTRGPLAVTAERLWSPGGRL